MLLTAVIADFRLLDRFFDVRAIAFFAFSGKQCNWVFWLLNMQLCQILKCYTGRGAVFPYINKEVLNWQRIVG